MVREVVHGGFTSIDATVIRWGPNDRKLTFLEYLVRCVFSQGKQYLVSTPHRERSMLFRKFSLLIFDLCTTIDIRNDSLITFDPRVGSP